MTPAELGDHLARLGGERSNAQLPPAALAPLGAPTEASPPSSRPNPAAPPSARPTTPPRAEPRSSRDLVGERELFGAPVAPPASRPKPPRTLAPAAAPAPAAPPPAPALTPAHLASFRDLHAEVCLVSPELGEVWLVAARTGQDRQEVTIEDVALLANISTAFPGSRVVELRKRSIGSAAHGGDALVSSRPGGAL